MNDKLLRTPIAESIDPQLVADITSRAPWVSIRGTFNARDVGGNIKPGFIFRSGTLENVEQAGLEIMRSLGIKTVFDLRSETERKENPEVELEDKFRGVWFAERERQDYVGHVTTPLEEIERDYSLTRVGIESHREFLVQKMLGSRLADGKAVDLNHPRVKMFAEPAVDAMETFLEGIKERYGGVDEYLVQALGFSKEEVHDIRQNLRGEAGI